MASDAPEENSCRCRASQCSTRATQPRRRAASDSSACRQGTGGEKAWTHEDARRHAGEKRGGNASQDMCNNPLHVTLNAPPKKRGAQHITCRSTTCRSSCSLLPSLLLPPPPAAPLLLLLLLERRDRKGATHSDRSAARSSPPSRRSSRHRRCAAPSAAYCRRSVRQGVPPPLSSPRSAAAKAAGQEARMCISNCAPRRPRAPLTRGISSLRLPPPAGCLSQC